MEFTIKDIIKSAVTFSLTVLFSLLFYFSFVVTYDITKEKYTLNFSNTNNAKKIKYNKCKI